MCSEHSFPDAYTAQMRSLLKEEANAFFASYADAPWRGIRFRDERRPLPASELLGPIPYAKNAFYLHADSKAGACPLHEAGAYYIQEPSAMAAATVLCPQKGDRVLDLCAAPGGKSTQLAMSAPMALLAANEPIPSRTQILSGNIERMGITNAIVTCAYPQQLASKWPGFFDRILVDAPCSGEGMFRRHPETVAEWSPETPQRCHQRQVEILRAAASMLREGGRMVYSTCTFNTIENENTISVFLNEHPHFHLIPISVPGLSDAPSGTLRLFPHTFRGEGHFIALLEKNKDASDVSETAKSISTLAPDRQALSLFSDFAEEMGLSILPNMQQGNRLFFVPSGVPPLDGIKTLRTGLHLAEIRGKNLFPDHALALSVPIKKRFEIDEKQAAAYLHGETLECPDEMRGYYVISYQGYQLGFGKASDGQMKNHYPKGLRK